MWTEDVSRACTDGLGELHAVISAVYFQHARVCAELNANLTYDMCKKLH